MRSYFMDQFSYSSLQLLTFAPIDRVYNVPITRLSLSLNIIKWSQHLNKYNVKCAKIMCVSICFGPHENVIKYAHCTMKYIQSVNDKI